MNDDKLSARGPVASLDSSAYFEPAPNPVTITMARGELVSQWQTEYKKSAYAFRFTRLNIASDQAV
jgi:hypothetical protein